MRTTDLEFNELDLEEFRLNAGFYLSEGIRHLSKPISITLDQAIRKIKNLKTDSLKNLSSDIILSKRFKRHYVNSEKYGVPFLSGTNITQLFPSPKYLSKSMHENDIEQLKIKKGWILVTCSGTIGNIALVWDDLDNWALTQHALRIIPDTNKIKTGFLFAFLNTEYAQSQILSYTHGSVIDEINSNQLGKVIVPLFPIEFQIEIEKKIFEAFDLLARSKILITSCVDEISKNLSN